MGTSMNTLAPEAAATRGFCVTTRNNVGHESSKPCLQMPTSVHESGKRMKECHVQYLMRPPEPNPSLGPGGGMLPEANPWAVRRMADLEELEPYNERRVTQRMGPRCEDFGTTVVGCRGPHRGTSLEGVGHPMELSEEGVHNGGAALTNNVRLGSSRSRLWQRTCCGITDKWRWFLDRGSPTSDQCVLRFMWTANAAHNHLLSSLRRGFCRDRSRYLGQVHIPPSLRGPICSAEPGNWSELQQHLAKHLCDVFKK